MCVLEYRCVVPEQLPFPPDTLYSRDVRLVVLFYYFFLNTLSKDMVVVAEVVGGSRRR